MSTTPPPPPSNPPLTLIIRFTTSLPDLPLTIASPKTTTPLTLNTLIRPSLPPSLAACPLRLIHAGGLLPPNIPIQTSLRLSATGKSPASLYIHCSISTDTHLSAADLEAETHAATSLQRSSHSSSHTSNDNGNDPDASTANAAGPSSEAAPSQQQQQQQPQGFDRLLSAGLTPTEVSALRTQFLAVQAHTHTPDTMPSPAEMRLLEERWLDAGTGPGGGGGGGGGGAGAEDDETGGSLEDMLWGNVMGFFWAVGAIVWLVREEGVWSKRRRVGVVTGVLVNIAFCVLRVGV